MRACPLGLPPNRLMHSTSLAVGPAHAIPFVFVPKTDKFQFALNDMWTVCRWCKAASQSHPHVRIFDRHVCTRLYIYSFPFLAVSLLFPLVRIFSYCPGLCAICKCLKGCTFQYFIFQFYINFPFIPGFQCLELFHALLVRLEIYFPPLFLKDTYYWSKIDYFI